MEKLRAAIVGCGSIYQNHAAVLEENENAQLVAVCDIDEEKARRAAQRYGCRAYTDFDEMLRQEAFEVLHICTPHYLHCPMAVAAMESGRHVLTEKPMAITEEDARRMEAVAQKTGRYLGVCFQNRYNATSVAMRNALRSGALGKIIGAKALVTWDRGADYFQSGAWRGTWAQEGGGVLINQSIHTLDLLQWLMDAPVTTLAASVSTKRLQDVIEVEDTADAVIWFQNGARALFYATLCYVSNSPVEVEIQCEKGVLRLADGLDILPVNGEVVHVEDERPVGEKDYWGLGHKLLISDFYRSIIEHTPFAVDGSQAKTAVSLVQAFYQSSRQGAPVHFDGAL